MLVVLMGCRQSRERHISLLAATTHSPQRCTLCTHCMYHIHLCPKMLQLVCEILHPVQDAQTSDEALQKHVSHVGTTIRAHA